MIDTDFEIVGRAHTKAMTQRPRKDPRPPLPPMRCMNCGEIWADHVRQYSCRCDREAAREERAVLIALGIFAVFALAAIVWAVVRRHP